MGANNPVISQSNHHRPAVIIMGADQSQQAAELMHTFSPEVNAELMKILQAVMPAKSAEIRNLAAPGRSRLRSIVRSPDFSFRVAKVKLASSDQPLAVKFPDLAILKSLRMRQSRTRAGLSQFPPGERRRSHEYDINRLEELYYDLMASYHHFRSVSCASSLRATKSKIGLDRRLREAATELSRYSLKPN